MAKIKEEMKAKLFLNDYDSAYAKAHQLTKKSNKRMELGFIPFNSENLKLMQRSSNYLLLVTRNGRYIVTPNRIVTMSQIKEFLGFRTRNIILFCPLPTGESCEFLKESIAAVAERTRDVYNYE